MARRAPWELWGFVAITVLSALGTAALAAIGALPAPAAGGDGDVPGSIMAAIFGVVIPLWLAVLLLAGWRPGWYITVGLVMLGMTSSLTHLAHPVTRADAAAGLLTSSVVLMLLLHRNVRIWVRLTPRQRAENPRLPLTLRRPFSRD